MLLITPQKIKDYENQADKAGFTFDQMMSIAGNGLASIIHSKWQSLPKKVVTGLIGGGKNGADTVIALTRLHSLGWETHAIIISSPPSPPSPSLPEWIVKEYEKTGESLYEYKDSHQCAKVIDNSSLILDGIIGTGFTPPLKTDLAEKMKLINGQCKGKTIIAVDCPSGVDCITGSIEKSTLSADLTVCMEGVKVGLIKFPAFEYAGELRTVDIGILKKIHRKKEMEDMVIDREFVSKVLPERKKESHKGTYGTVLVCGGSVNYPGAPVFVARAAYRMGTGLVKTAVPERIYGITAGQCLESTWIILDDENGVICDSAVKVLNKELNKVTCLAIGPGMGTEETTYRFFDEALTNPDKGENLSGIGFLPMKSSTQPKRTEMKCPVVVDADGLRMLAKIPNWSSKINHTLVLTPHPGEMSELTGLSIDEIQNDRIEVCRQFAIKWQQVVVLKGALTVVATPDGHVGVSPIASSALAKAGSGDVLTGLISGLIAQGVGLFSAACAGVWIHGNAGLIAAERMGNKRSNGIEEILESLPASIALAENK